MLPSQGAGPAPRVAPDYVRSPLGTGAEREVWPNLAFRRKNFLWTGRRKPDASAAACGHPRITKEPADAVDSRVERMMGP